MNKRFHEKFTVDEVPLPSERSTGLVFTAVALIVAFFWRSSAIVLFVSVPHQHSRDILMRITNGGF